MELNEWKLGAIISVFSFLGLSASSIVATIWTDANTQQLTDVQLIEIAVDVLDKNTPTTERNALALREWAVDTINEAADVEIVGPARDALVLGGITKQSGFVSPRAMPTNVLATIVRRETKHGAALSNSVTRYFMHYYGFSPRPTTTESKGDSSSKSDSIVIDAD